jgi:ribonucleoside-diphosphate reductase alpha chain
MCAATISNNASIILKKRYLSNGESVEGMFRRVANGNEDYYNLMADLRFLPNSPTLFNAGLNNGCTLSACFTFSVEDSMLGKNSIDETRGKAIAVAKAGGGVGYYFGNLRPKGSPIKSIHRVACGPVVVLKDYHAVSALITQGGKRELAQMGVLPVWHDDIRDFIHCKDEDPQGIGSFNISVSWGDDWISKVDLKNNSSNNGRQQNKETSLWFEQCQSAWKTGCPGMYFVDTVNKSNPNPHLGLWLTPNPCGEVPGRDSEPCNLGSLSLPRYWIKGRRNKKGLDMDRLANDVRIATRFLDDILDWNTFPHPDITKASLLTRKLGLGVMGWADLLALCHIHYDSKEAVEFGQEVMGMINYEAGKESERLADIKGPYEGFCEVKTNGPKKRNETNTSVAPTGTIAIIANVWGSIEPHYILDCERTTAENIKLNDGMSEWVRAELDGFVPKIASEVSPEWHVRHQAAFQKHTDLGVSKTVNLPNSATLEDVAKTYKLMHDLGCKGGTIYRDGCRAEQVLRPKQKTKSVYLENGVSHNETESAHATPSRVILPNEREGKTHKLQLGGLDIYLTANTYPTPDKLMEIFIVVNPQQGSTLHGFLDAFAKTFSVALQYGAPLEHLVKLHRNCRFEPNGLTGTKGLPTCTSILDYIVRYLELKFSKVTAQPISSVKQVLNSGSDSGLFCPECGAAVVYQAGCLTCMVEGCGWSRCG